MRFVYGALAIWIWINFLHGISPGLSDEATIISCAIVAAGAMAGGA